MTGKQLQIGCIILKPNGEPEQIAEIKMPSVRFVGDTKFTKLSLCKPVELSEEWLLKLGFKKWGRDDLPRTLSYEFGAMQIFPSNSFCNFKGYGFLHFKLPNPIDGKDESAKFKFQCVHELQIIYTALTGEELKLIK